MPFVTIEARSDAEDNRRLPATVSYTLRHHNNKRSARPVLRVTLNRPMTEKCGVANRAPCGLQVGSGEEAGRLRVLFGAAATHPIGEGFIGKQGVFSVGFGHIAELGTEERDARKCNARVVEPGVVEVDVSGWEPEGSDMQPADSRPAERRPAVPSADVAAEAKTVTTRANGSVVTVVTTPKEEAIGFRGQMTELTARPAALAAILAKAMPLPVGREFIRDKLWPGAKPDTWEPMLTGITGQLRAAARTIGLDIETVRGIGIAMKEAA